ncbi:MAG: hypothetical protein ACRDLP_13650 [Solirubrobacteraceae bacterium]
MLRGGILAAAVVLGAAVAAADASSAPSSCAPPHAKILATSGNARIYSLTGAIYGCLGHRDTLLAGGPSSGPATRVGVYALAGRYAGTDVVQMGVDTLSSTVFVTDLGSGGTVATAAATTPENRAESFTSVSALKVTSSGALAWIGRRSAVGVPKATFEVHTLRGGSNHLLATSTAIAPHSLALKGSTLSWSQGGRTRTARMP